MKKNRGDSLLYKVRNKKNLPYDEKVVPLGVLYYYIQLMSSYFSFLKRYRKGSQKSIAQVLIQSRERKKYYIYNTAFNEGNKYFIY
jgi:hypothetical protein